MYVSVLGYLHRIKSSRRGQTLVEYGLILSLIAIAAIGVMKVVGGKSASNFSQVASALG